MTNKPRSSEISDEEIKKLWRNLHKIAPTASIPDYYISLYRLAYEKGRQKGREECPYQPIEQAEPPDKEGYNDRQTERLKTNKTKDCRCRRSP